jgi:hypothetical protein
MSPLPQLLETIRDVSMAVDAVVPSSSHRELYQQPCNWIICEGLLEPIEEEAFDIASHSQNKCKNAPTRHVMRTQDCGKSQGVDRDDSSPFATSQSASLPLISEKRETTQLPVQGRDMSWQCCHCGRLVVIGEGELCTDRQHRRWVKFTTAMEVIRKLHGVEFGERSTGMLGWNTSEHDDKTASQEMAYMYKVDVLDSHLRSHRGN